MPSRQELNARARVLGVDPASYPNDSKLEQKILYLEKNATTYTETLGTGTFTIAGADVANNDTVTIGNRTYTFKTALTGAKATSVLTGTDVFSEGETITIQGRTYTMKATPVGANDVAIGASLAASLDNLKQAINQGDSAYPTAPSNEGRGTNWGYDTKRHDYVTATTNTNTQQTIEAREFGTLANYYTTAETCANASWTSTVMAGGVANVPDQIKIGSSAAETLDFLKDAINNTAVTGAEGTAYSYGTYAHEQVTATTNSATQQVVQARNAAFDNASIATSVTGGGNIAAGAATLSSGVRGTVALASGTTVGVRDTNAGIAGDKNL